jgi:hypothetical protein
VNFSEYVFKQLGEVKQNNTIFTNRKKEVKGMSNYIRPEVRSMDSLDLVEFSGVVQTQAYMTLEGYKGASLHQEKSYRYCELRNQNNLSDKIYSIDNQGVIKNA